MELMGTQTYSQSSCDFIMQWHGLCFIITGVRENFGICL